MNWDWLISAAILIVLALGFWARISRQTIPELIGGIMEKLRDKGEEGEDYVEEVIYQ